MGSKNIPDPFFFVRPYAGGEARWRDQGPACQKQVGIGLTLIGSRITRLHSKPKNGQPLEMYDYKTCPLLTYSILSVR